MGKSIKEWEKSFKKYDIKTLREIADAIERLERIQELKDEFDWTGLFLLKTVIKGVIRQKQGD